MFTTALQTVSPHWYLTGWVLSIVMLLLGFLIGHYYYDGTTGGEPA